MTPNSEFKQWPPVPTSTLSSPSLESLNVIETLKANLRQKTFKSSAAIPAVPKFADKYEEREFLKFRLAQAFRIFGKLGYDEGAAGHITVTVSFVSYESTLAHFHIGPNQNQLLLAQPACK